MKSLALIICHLLLMCAASVATAGDNHEKEILSTVQKFYYWVLKNDKAVSALEPRIVDDKNSNRFHLDIATLPNFSQAFVDSGLFTGDFKEKVSAYYMKYKVDIDKYPQKDFDEVAAGGRGPQMEVEDMDIFFCAQEYEYDKKFIDAMKIDSLTLRGNKAEAVIVSPYEWKTTFQMVNENGKWLISGYCVYL